ncbi:MAG: inositol monophosphatase, partial [Prevotellaceae bacterium]|nr:inositol monophosphatase [Prevotellaceae bacterium]
KEICEEVCKTAAVAGKFIADETKNFSISKVEQKNTNDFVSYVDKNAEKIIVQGLLPLIENAGFITEEGTVNQSNDKEYTWIIDPLDGTTNYIHGLDPYAVSIGLTENKKLILGVVYIAGTNECFYAWKDSKAFLNGIEIRTSETVAVSNSLVISGFPYKIAQKIDNYLDVIRHLTFNSHGVRRLGSAAADLVYVACGRAEIFFQTDLNPWDVAAGAFIAERAGATVTDFAGGDTYLSGKTILATGNQTLNSEMIKLLANYF